MLNVDIVTRSMNSLIGTAQNRAWRSIEQSFCATDLISNLVSSPLAPSIYDWAPYADLHMRHNH
jgi:hypothetical protein